MKAPSFSGKGNNFDHLYQFKDLEEDRIKQIVVSSDKNIQENLYSLNQVVYGLTQYIKTVDHNIDQIIRTLTNEIGAAPALEAYDFRWYDMEKESIEACPEVYHDDRKA